MGIVHQPVGQLPHLLLEVSQLAVEVAMGEEGVGEEHAHEGGRKAQREVVGDEPLLHAEDELPVAVVPVDARLGERPVVEDARALARELVLGVVGGVDAVLLILEGRQVGGALEGRAARRDELVHALASPMRHRVDGHGLAAPERDLGGVRSPSAALMARRLVERSAAEAAGGGLHVADEVDAALPTSLGRLHRGEPAIATEHALRAKPGLDEAQRRSRRVAVLGCVEARLLLEKLEVLMRLLALADLDGEDHARERAARRLELGAQRLGLPRHPRELRALLAVALALLAAPRRHGLVHAQQPARVDDVGHLLVEGRDHRLNEAPLVAVEGGVVRGAEGEGAPDGLPAVLAHAVATHARRRQHRLGDRLVAPHLLSGRAGVEGEAEGVAPPAQQLALVDLQVRRVVLVEVVVGVLDGVIDPRLRQQQVEKLVDRVRREVAPVERRLRARHGARVGRPALGLCCRPDLAVAVDLCLLRRLVLVLIASSAVAAAHATPSAAASTNCRLLVVLDQLGGRVAVGVGQQLQLQAHVVGVGVQRVERRLPVG